MVKKINLLEHSDRLRKAYPKRELNNQERKRVRPLMILVLLICLAICWVMWIIEDPLNSNHVYDQTDNYLAILEFSLIAILFYIVSKVGKIIYEAGVEPHWHSPLG